MRSAWLADRHGTGSVVAAGGLARLGAGLVAATAPEYSVALLAVALFLLKGPAFLPGD